jgi:TrpR-related protein YerC/YecD
MLKQRARPRAAAPPAPSPGREAWLTESTLDLLRTIVALRTIEEAERFFRDLCTVPELHTLAARWRVAKLLDQDVPYGEIARRTGASTATITRINSWRRFGMGGYRLLLDRMRARRR